MPIRRFDPTCRLKGWKYLAGHVDAVRAELAAEGVDALVAGLSWNLPGQLGLSCEGHPAVYSFGPAFGDRHSQYDVWHPNPVADAQAFVGRTFVYVGVGAPPLWDAFEKIEGPRRVVYREGSDAVAVWDVWVCRGYRGFPANGASVRRY